jgi:hypothetical protein
MQCAEKNEETLFMSWGVIKSLGSVLIHLMEFMESVLIHIPHYIKDNLKYFNNSIYPKVDKNIHLKQNGQKI